MQVGLSLQQTRNQLVQSVNTISTVIPTRIMVNFLQRNLHPGDAEPIVNVEGENSIIQLNGEGRKRGKTTKF